MSDHELHEFDLSAWEAPTPPSGLADAVLARLREPAAAVAVEPDSRPARWWWLGGALAAAAAAAIVLVIVLGSGERTTPPLGAIAADRARRLDLVSASAELDAGTLVTWHRDRDALAIAQPRGSAVWRVTGDEQIRIETGATGALVEASGASLRVEVHMNFSDARVIGASTLTAAAVAFITVVVYEGHVKATSGGQTVNIEPGTTVELHTGQPPAPPDRVGDMTRTRLRFLELQIKQLQDQVQALQGTTTAPAGGPRIGVEIHTGSPLALSLDKNAISAAMDAVKPQIKACATSKSGLVKAHVKVAPDGSVTDVEITQTPEPELGDCVASVLRGATFVQTQTGGSFSYPFVFEVSPPASCDADALKDKGMQDEANGQHKEALASFEQALKCKADAHGIQLAYMASCNAENVPKARLYYKRLPPDMQDRLVVLCIRRNITKETLDAP
jgi:ferric-dicitrate binding protein FerR (iron transport regulator)